MGDVHVWLLLLAGELDGLRPRGACGDDATEQGAGEVAGQGCCEEEAPRSARMHAALPGLWLQRQRVERMQSVWCGVLMAANLFLPMPAASRSSGYMVVCSVPTRP